MKYKKIYMLTPPNYVTGGVEACFQIADAINNQGGECYTVFTANVPNPVPEEYKRYNIKNCNGLIDNGPSNLFIVPEIFPHVLEDPQLANMHKSIWWLSVDHNRDSTKDFSKDILHLYQSEYAKNFLVNKTEKVLPVFDYLSDEYFDEYDKQEKKNRICYSIKGKDLAERLKEFLPQYEFVMLVGMTRLQVIETLKTSKVFIDFGYHPGKDRIPREAAMLHNCVITNRKGSANFELDVPILDKYKIESENIEDIVSCIVDCMENYDESTKDFDSYRKEIKNQKAEFFEHVKNLING